MLCVAEKINFVMRTESIKCPICKLENTKTIFTKGDLNLDVTNVICNACGLVYINPRPSEDEFMKWQKDSEQGSGHHTRNTKEKAEKKVSDSDRQMKEAVFGYLQPFTRENIKILDIGCGFGTLLNIIKEKTGLAGDGLEIYESDVRMAEELFGLMIYQGTLKDFHHKVFYQGGTSGVYDLIILHHTFEHFADPLAELQRIQDLLVPEGLLYIAVPNILNIKKRPEIFFQLGHAFSYSPASLNKMLKKAGFKIIAFNFNAAYPGGMECMAKKQSSVTLELVDSVLEKGHPAEVVAYVSKKEREFSAWRRWRDMVLFFIPKSWRVKLGRIIYLRLKKYG